ncbi:hypothetical protein [Vibrio parahaemolyticus]|uniref:hypothetical protein n=1 Tax=Vibrio parahaemolyticus TaxID=670 RepID=UPI001E2C74D2|nr:hypothetical protein [Vibrio parahaemolyticus]
MSIDLFLVWFAVSEADLLVESQLCGIVFSNELFGVVRLHSTALFVPSGFSDRRFETAPDLSISRYEIWALAKSSKLQVTALGLATNKLFKRDSQRLAVWC